MRFLRILLAALSLSLVAVSAGASPSDPKEGTDYLTLSEPQPTDSGNKVEVIEFFSYGCPHCYAMDPSLTGWVKKQGDKIAFKRIPVGFHSSWVPLQKLYYSLEAMGKVEELHPKIFRAIHEQHVQLDSDDVVTDWVARQGIDKAKFIELYNSFGIQIKVRRASQLQEQYKIDSIPTVVIGGRYVTSPSIVGTSSSDKSEPVLQAKMLQVADALVARLSKNEKPQAAEPAKKKAAH
jgi:thiol:disulfide interchange protein DsbA